MQDAAKLAAYTNRLIFGATQRKQFKGSNSVLKTFCFLFFPTVFLCSSIKVADVGVTGGTNIILQW